MKNNKLTGILLAAMMTVSAIGAPTVMTRMGLDSSTVIVQTITADAAEGRLFNQNAKQWQSKRYYYGRTSDTLYSAGCGIFALGNAIYALNGNQVNIDAMATWGARNGYWRPGSGGTVRGTFYKNASAVYGASYGFKETGEYWGNIWNGNLINGLQNGKVAVAHVSNHFIAITGYNARNKTYHVIESAVYKGRGLSSDSWVSASKLNSGKTKVDWFCLLEKSQPTSQSDPINDGKIYTIAPKGKKLYLSAAGTKNLANVRLSDTINNASKWKAHKTNNGWYFENMYAHKVLDVNGSTVKSGQNVQVYAYNKAATEYFTLKSYGGYYILQTTNAKVAIDCYGSSSSLKNNSNVWTYSINYDATQLFQFTQVG